jgi:transposase
VPASPPLASTLTGWPSRAIDYALGQWKYLVRYVEDGRAPVDNNLIERDILGQYFGTLCQSIL